jgi:hypothetical protein
VNREGFCRPLGLRGPLSDGRRRNCPSGPGPGMINACCGCGDTVLGRFSLLGEAVDWSNAEDVATCAASSCCIYYPNEDGHHGRACSEDWARPCDEAANELQGQVVPNCPP